MASEKLTNHLFFPEEDCWCRRSWIIPSKTSITTIPLSTTIYKLPLGTRLMLYNERIFSSKQSGPLLEYQNTLRNIYSSIFFDIFKNEDVKLLTFAKELQHIFHHQQYYQSWPFCPAFDCTPTFQDSYAEFTIVVITSTAWYLHSLSSKNFILDLWGGWAAPVQPGRRPQRGGRPGHQEGGEAQADEGAGKGMGCRPQSCFPTQQVPTRPWFLYLPGVQVQPGLPSLSQRTVGAWMV